MQAQATVTQEKHSTTTPRVTQESSHGGTAMLVDNRPATVYQRKLQEAMTLQRSTTLPPRHGRTPQGSARFQQIATAMGSNYGVDTSDLVATHNSSFPRSLNAEATIHGNRIHFAPGRDTDYHIKHEVAHAIDNTLHGTPKGDRVVQGQRVDTTREKVVDQMAGRPILQYRPRGRWDQERLARSEEKLDAKVVGRFTPRIAYATVQNNLPSIPLPTPTPLATPGLRRPASSYTPPIQCYNQHEIEKRLKTAFIESQDRSAENQQQNIQEEKTISIARSIIAAVKEMPREVVEHSDFPKALYNVVSEIRKSNNVADPQPELKEAAPILSDKAANERAEFNKKWTIYLRHYSTGRYDPLRSQAQLTTPYPISAGEAEGTAAKSSETEKQQVRKRRSGNTNRKDWLTGNTGYIFALVCIGGKGGETTEVPKRGFLAHANYYKQSKMEDYSYVWISSDANRQLPKDQKEKNIYGSGEAVRDALIDMIMEKGKLAVLRGAGGSVLQNIEHHFVDLEAKVTPHEIEKHSGAWQAVG